MPTNNQNKNLHDRGSLWKKWDLQIHTPHSLVNYYEGTNENEKWDKFISDIESLPPEFKVIGINDYLFIDGYKKVLEYKNYGRLENIELILPVYECRIRKFAGHKEFRRINFHVIFSNELSPQIIEQQFLNALTAEYKLKTGLNGIAWSGSITKESLEDLGRKIKQSSPKDKEDDYGNDLEEGFNNLNLEEKSILDILRSNSFLEGKYLTAIGKAEWDQLSWNDQSIAEKKDIINKVNFVFISSENIEKFNKAKEKLKEQNCNDLLLDCSDAHFNANSSNKDRIGKCFTWIKADSTFEGLKQIIYGPEERVYIGAEPEIRKRVRENKTKFIKALKINQVQGYNGENGIWFKNIEISLNPGFVSIIGNRGSGKSALTDIISLCGNSHLYTDFSFLTAEKFLQNGLAENFEAELIWESDGDAVRKKLSDSIDPNSPERVRYLPQNFFERLTNNLETYEFEQTLRRVVFLYIPEAKKLGKNNFKELIKYKRRIVNKDIENICKEIIKINRIIIDCETKFHPEYKMQIEQKLVLKTKELKEHEKIKPREVPNPEKNETLSKELIDKQKKIQSLSINLNTIEIQIKDVQNKLKEVNIQIQDLQTIRDEILDFKREIDVYIKNNTKKLEKYGLDLNEILSIKIDINKIESKIDEKDYEQKELKNKLMTEEEIKNIDKSFQESVLAINLEVKIKTLKDSIEKIKNQLSEPQKKYQLYLEELKKWENKKKEIEGDERIPDSLKWLEKELKYIDEQLQSDIDKLRNQRLNLAIQIYNGKKEVVDIYKEFKENSDKKITEFQNILGEFKITIDASLKIESSFYDDFLKFINKKMRGSFYGVDEGKTMLDRIVKENDINNETGVKTLLSEIIDYLEIDKRVECKGKNEIRYIKDQIIKEDKWTDFYDYVFSLNYIEPVYELKLGNKNLTQLSPGEKGALLIVFYLLLDKEDIPLVIDQPEENLDNESVYKILRHFIKYAKKERQVIIVTHNPNLAIVGDAEQIIFVKIDKEKQNEFSFESGAIENPKINKHASDILEGTLKAFDIRRLKYLRI